MHEQNDSVGLFGWGADRIINESPIWRPNYYVPLTSLHALYLTIKGHFHAGERLARSPAADSTTFHGFRVVVYNPPPLA
jgi:hypothetical protein